MSRTALGLMVSQDFVAIGGYDGQGEWISTIISGTGEPLVLSDLFYDSVNYISYINQNLFNETTNAEYYSWLHAEELYAYVGPHDPPTGFTGLPNDYPNFSIDNYGAADQSNGLLITFFFAQGNPFFSESVEDPSSPDPHSSNAASIGLMIPSDLSPYGRISSATWTQNSAGQIYPVLTTTSVPSNQDSTLNGKIGAQVTAHPEMACFHTEYGTGRVSLLGYVKANECTGRGEGNPGMPTLLGQWAFATWDDDPMSITDLPDTWRTQFTFAVFDGDICSLQDESDCQGWSDITSFSSAASVRSVWSNYGTSILAIVEDQGFAYVVSFDN